MNREPHASPEIAQTTILRHLYESVRSHSLEIASGWLAALNIISGVAVINNHHESKTSVIVEASEYKQPQSRQIEPTTTTSLPPPTPETTTLPPTTVPIESPTTTTTPVINHPFAATHDVRIFAPMPARNPFATTPGAIGTDASFPQCENETSPLAQFEVPEDSQFGIVGVNGGRPFTMNPCLKSEFDKFQNPDLYINASFPGNEQASTQLEIPMPATTENLEATLNRFEIPIPSNPEEVLNIPYVWGSVFAKYAWDYSVNSGAEAAFYWIDVEELNSWDGSYEEHQFVIHGVAEALRNLSLARYGQEVGVGIYSVPDPDPSNPNKTGMWTRITGRWPSGHINWVALGLGSKEEAVQYCEGYDFTGGGTAKVQYGDETGLDRNVNCPDPIK